MFALGVAAALVASVLFNVGIALQALEARAAPRSTSLRLSLLGRLFRRRRWVLGLVLGAIGIAPQIYAFANASFVVVQPTLAVGLLLLLALGSRTLKEHVGVPEVVGVVAIIAGVGLLAWGAPPHSEAHRGTAAALGVVGFLSITGLVPFPLRNTRFNSAMLTVIASGCAFAATNVATKLLSDAANGGDYLGAALWGLLGLTMGVAATVTQMTAFQLRRATMVVPVSTAVQTFLPIVLEPFFLRERWGSADYYGIPIAAGLLIALLGTVLVSRTRAVSKLASGAQAR